VAGSCECCDEPSGSTKCCCFTVIIIQICAGKAVPFYRHELNYTYICIFKLCGILIVKMHWWSLYCVTKYTIWNFVSSHFCITSHIPIIWWAAVVFICHPMTSFCSQK
jgi:hypothetical protein